MFTAYAIDLNASSDNETPCKTLDEALAHLRELIAGEIKQAGSSGPRFERYGISIDPHAMQKHELADEGPFDPWYTSQRLMKKHGLEAEQVLGSLIHSLWSQHFDVNASDRKPIPHANSVLEMMMALIKDDHNRAHRRVLEAIETDPRSEVIEDKKTAKEKSMLSELLQQTLDFYRSETDEAGDEDEEDDD